MLALAWSMSGGEGGLRLYATGRVRGRVTPGDKSSAREPRASLLLAGPVP
jgi:hypothetical protein